MKSLFLSATPFARTRSRARLLGTTLVAASLLPGIGVKDAGALDLHSFLPSGTLSISQKISVENELPSLGYFPSEPAESFTDFSVSGEIKVEGLIEREPLSLGYFGTSGEATTFSKSGEYSISGSIKPVLSKSGKEEASKVEEVELSYFGQSEELSTVSGTDETFSVSGETSTTTFQLSTLR